MPPHQPLTHYPDVKANILLVDDDPANLLALEAVLEDLGHPLVKATSGEQALRLLTEADFAVVLLDVRMHGLDGFETAKRIRRQERSRHTPIIFITGFDDGRFSVEAAYALGAVDYLLKPLVPIILRAKVAGFVELFQKSARLRLMDRRQFELALAEENARVRTLSDNLPFGAVYQVREDGQGGRRFLYISAGVERLFGVTPAEATADATALYGLIHEDDRLRLAAAEEVALRDLAPFDCEFRSYTRAGDVRWVHCRSAPRRLPSGEVIWEGIILDSTDRKRAEAALRREQELLEALFERIPVMLTVYEPNTKVVRLNPTFERTLGWSTRDAAGGSLMEQCYPDPAYREQVAEFMRTCREGWLDVRMRTRDGRNVETSWANVRLSDGRQVGIGIDITDRKRYEQSLQDADRRKDEFLAMLAHELRNPLAPIRNATHTLNVLGPADPNLQNATAIIGRQVRHLTRLVDDLLDVSRITRGKITLRKEPVELAAVVAQAVETSRPLLEARGHELTVELPHANVRVEADVTRLAQVLGNLLTNAAKYTAEGGHIRLTVEAGPDESVIRVQDDGMGIAPELLPQVFDLFTQGDRSLARSEGGLGIGLTLVKSLVELHGGGIEARSDGPGKGSEFLVRLPTLPPAPSNAADEGRHSAGQPSAPRRVLVVDDNKDAADSLALLLQTTGHEVRTAHDGPAALEVAKAFRPEVVLLDIGLPRMDGYEVARRLRQEPGLEETVLAALTGYGQEDDRRRTQEAGFDEHLVKPVDPAELEKVIAAAARAE